MPEELKMIIITGLSGSGKSTAMAAFEDAGFYCVDNMPVSLLPDFLNLPIKKEYTGLAFVMDLREKYFLDRYERVFESLGKTGYRFEIIFFEADENVLLRRYSQTRRFHPLARTRGVLEGIRLERQKMMPLRRIAGQVIDTSNYTIHELKSRIFDIAREKEKRIPLRITILTFGFKYGLPNDADLVMDVRFVANPYFVPELKPLDGRAPEIQNYVINRDITHRFIEKYTDLLDFLIPLYEKEGKAYLTIAIGCTGGRHRSVAIACSIYEHIKGRHGWVHIVHRDIGKDN
ncbi:RNase adaptor protein RapZ [Desulfococcus multivorans]|uniref:UPF0042 nucleotide-binding protein yhbJ n=2 Tax=Desulfococcus multivorans TaxID=897 RepID=S7TQG4_DESML|nr:UPF0042 nbucleotide-binding protein [Desulfococcus multivorans]AQV00195.1 RNase adaptor protein RapZ [Desulfococcus multivorans]EPR38895.1 UPF0042 nucleotide-binding protein yhbJ [Desulfococcus multivorans DSM 2059]SJZ67793.1 UPF0042 nucleotide-binding protein [Desulfococcus multivorans DSM 2059]